MRSRIEEKRAREKVEIYPEMCECCGKSFFSIYRTVFFSKKGIKYVIRHCVNCNPYEKWITLNVD